MANVIPALVQMQRNGQDAFRGGMQDLVMGIKSIKDRNRREKIKTLGQQFIKQGDYSPEGIQRFAQQNNLAPQDMSGIVQVAGAFEQFKRQRDQDALEKQRYADKQKYYGDQLALDREKMEYNKSRLAQNDQVSQQKEQRRAEQDYRKTLANQYELIRKTITGKDSTNFMLDYDPDNNPMISQSDFDKLVEIRNSGGSKSNQAAKALNIYSRLAGVDIPPPPEIPSVGLMNMGGFGAVSEQPRRPPEVEGATEPDAGGNAKKVTLDDGKTVVAQKAPDGKYYYEENGKFYLVEE